MKSTDFKIIISIVNKGDACHVVAASKKVGAEGGTIVKGRGTGIHETMKLFGSAIEPEKEIVLTLVPENIKDKVLESIIKEAGLNKPGKGIAFLLDVERVAGITHLLDDEMRDKLEDKLEDNN